MKLNKRLKKKLQTNKELVKGITYQEAWNKVAEYMNIEGNITFCIRPWSTNSVLDKGCEDKFCLVTLDNGGYKNHFVADKEWK